MAKYLFIIFITFSLNSYGAAPKICVTIKPLHTLVEAVTKGIIKPCLLIDKNASPHHYMFKPSDAKKISESDIIFLISDKMESFISKAKSINGTSEYIEVAKIDGLSLLPFREHNIWGEDHHDHHHDEHGYDYHIWLDADNSIKIINNISEILAKKDPHNKSKYYENAQAASVLIKKKDAEINLSLSKINEIPYLVFHDAYQYFEKRYKLKSVGAITVNPAKAPGAKTLIELSDIIKEKNAKCLFREPQFNSSITENISHSTGIKVDVLDAEWGVNDDKLQGAEAYNSIIGNLADNLIRCLTSK